MLNKTLSFVKRHKKQLTITEALRMHKIQEIRVKEEYAGDVIFDFILTCGGLANFCSNKIKDIDITRVFNQNKQMIERGRRCVS